MNRHVFGMDRSQMVASRLLSILEMCPDTFPDATVRKPDTEHTFFIRNLQFFAVFGTIKGVLGMALPLNFDTR